MKQFYLLVLMTILTRFGSQAGPHLVTDKAPIGGVERASARVSTRLDSPQRSMIDYTGNRLFAAELLTDHPPKASGDGIGNGLATAGSPPVVTLSPGPTQTTNSPLNASIGIASAIDPLMQVSDSDSPTLASATFTITNFQSQEDVLYFSGPSGDIGNISNSYNASKGELVLTSAGATATIAQWQRALRSATYRNIATHPNATQRNVSVVVNDGSNTSAVVNRTLIVNVSKPTINEFTATPSAVCTDNTVTFTARTSTISIPYNYTLTNGVQSVTGTINTGGYPDFTKEVRTSGSGTQRFTLTIIADGESVSATTDVAVYSTPTAYSVTGGGTYCTGASSGAAVGLSGSQTGVNYQLLLNGTAVGSALAGTGSSLNFGNQASAGTYTVQATNAIANCSQTTAMEGSVTVTVRQSLVITSQTQSAINVCGPGNRGLFEVRFAGTGPFTAVLFRDNVQLNQVSGSGNVIGFGFPNQVLQSGSYQIVVTTPCNSVTTTFAPIVVNDLPTPSFNRLANSYCQNASSVSLSNVVSPTGGEFTIDGTKATSLNPATLSVGDHTVVYSYTNSGGCRGTVSQTVTIKSVQAASITGLAAAYCQDASNVTLAPLGSPPGGIFTIDGSFATVLNPATLSLGDHSIRYSYTDANSCTSADTKTVTIKQTPTAPTVATQSGGPYPEGVSSLTISQNTGNVILTVSGCSGGTITWNGGSANTLAVSTANLGTQTFTATCTSNGCISPAATATVTVIAPTLKVLSRDPDNGQLNNNTIKPYLLLQNAGTTPIAYSTITLRYWLTTENNIPLIFQKNYVQIGQGNLNLRYVPLNPSRQGATGYIEYSFNAGAGSLAPNGDSGPLEVQLTKQDYRIFNQRDDYSYINNSSYTLNPRITAYQNGVIFYGQEPSGAGSPREAVAEANQVLNVTVLGNPVVGPSAEVEISGVSGQAVELKLIDLQGKLLHGHSIKEAGSVERVSLPLGTAQGLLLLDVSTINQRRQVKLVRP